MRYIFLILVFTVHCSKVKDESTVKDFFRKNQIGSSADVGLFKSNWHDSGSYMIATFHGMYDDMEICNDVVNMLRKNEDYNSDKYYCSFIN